MKVGDYIILKKGDSYYMDYLIGIPCKVTKITQNTTDLLEIYHDKMNESENHYFIPSDEFEIISKEVYESSLYQALKED